MARYRLAGDRVLDLTVLDPAAPLKFGLGLILLGVVLLLNVLIALVRRWRERSELGEGRHHAVRDGAHDLAKRVLEGSS